MGDIILGMLLLFSSVSSCYYWKDKLNIKTKDEKEFERRWEDCE